MTEREKEKWLEKAKMFRQCADIIEELVETEDKEKAEELAGKLMVQMIRIGM